MHPYGWKTIAGRLAELGHEVTIGTRDPEGSWRSANLTGSEPADFEWLVTQPDVQLRTFVEAAAVAEMVVNATNGEGSLDALRAAGARRT